jgi:hypothetical protein
MYLLAGQHCRISNDNHSAAETSCMVLQARRTPMKSDAGSDPKKDISDLNMLEEFILLFVALGSVVLNDQKDEIHWRWTSNCWLDLNPDRSKTESGTPPSLTS